MKRILFLTNGHGEDLIAASIIKLLQVKNPDIKISVFPMVGIGRTFEPLRVEILGPRKPMPSGGFMYQSIKLMVKDISKGLIGTTLEQIKLLRTLKGKYDLVFAIGDIVPIIGAIVSKIPFIFYGCAKSDYYSYSYTMWEKWFMKKYALLVMPRDKKTTENLVKAGIKAEYLGNPMMDAIKITGEDFGINPNAKVIGILPGSREDVLINIDNVLDIIKEIESQKDDGIITEYLVAFASNLDSSRLTDLNHLASGTWNLTYTTFDEKKIGLEAILKSGELEVKITQGKFGDVLNKSNIIIGLSGTGNEQAVGIGKPLVTFAGRGVQHTKKYAKTKKELLGDSLSLVDSNPDIVASEVWKILKNPFMMEQMRNIGRERMGDIGATEKIVERIQEFLK